MSKTINVGRVTAYAEAVAGGYTGTLEDWERDLANLGTTAAEVEANRQAVAEDKAAVEGDVTTVGEYKDAAAQSASEALQSAESAHTDALASTAAKEAAQTAQGLAEEARADAVSAKEAAENAQTEANASASAATEAALAAGNAAQTATAQAGAASDSATAAAASAASVSGVVQEVTAAKTEAITAIEAKGAETLDSIPDDYTALQTEVNNLKSKLYDSAMIHITAGPARRLHVDDSAGGIPLRTATVAFTSSMSLLVLRICKNNLYHEMSINDRRELNKDNGELVYAYGNAATDYIDVHGINSIIEWYDGSTSGGWYHTICKYDTNKQFVSGARTTQSGGNKYFTTNVADAAYVRISTARDLMAFGRVMICASDNITSYTVQMGRTISEGYVDLLGGKAYDTSGDEPVSYDITPLALVSYDEPWDMMAHLGLSEVTYIADATKAYKSSKRSLQSIIAGIETSAVASHTYDVGDMLIMGDDLYRVIAAIANGGTITVGTNVTKTTVAEQLIALANA